MVLSKQDSSRHIMQVLLITVGWMALSLSIYARHYLSLADQPPDAGADAETDIAFTLMGVPHWFVLVETKADASPDLTDLHDHDGAVKRGMGLRRDPFALPAAVALGSVFGYLLCATARWMSRRGIGRVHRGRLWVYALPLLPAGIFAALPVETPEWLWNSLSLIIVPLGLVLAVAWLRSYLHGTLLSILVFVSYFWTNRIADLFRTKHLIHGLPDQDDLMDAAVIIAPTFLLTLVATLAARVVAAHYNRRASMNANVLQEL